jgi:cysteine desulfurase/selenocysteine lyase
MEMTARRTEEKFQFNPHQYRGDFPILGEKVHGKQLIYLDNAATTQKPIQVIDAISDYYRHYNANVHRAIHKLGETATEAFENSRKTIARFISAPSEKQVIFTRGTTEAINLVASGWGRKFIGAGDEIILSEMEHHSNLIPWQLLAKEVGAKLKFIPFKEDGTIDFPVYETLLSSHTKLVTITHMSNVFGTINPVIRIVQMAHDRGIPVLFDAAQSVPHLPVNVEHLYAKSQILENMNPYQGGGEMISSVWFEEATWNEIPHKFEAGTPNIAGAIGMAKAVEYLENVGMVNLTLYEQELTTHGLEKMAEIPGMKIYGAAPERPGMKIYGAAPERGGIISFNLGDIHPHDLSHFLDQQGIAVRAGHHCAQPVMRKLNIAATTRVSFYFYNTKEEIDYFIDQLKKAREFFAY